MILNSFENCSRISWIDQIAVEGCLVNFKCKSIIEEGVLTYIQPGAVSAGLSLFAIEENPLVDTGVVWVNLTLDMALYLGEQLVVDEYVALRGSTDSNFTLTTLHLVNVIFKFFTGALTSEIFEFESIIRNVLLLCLRRAHLNKYVNITYLY